MTEIKRTAHAIWNGDSRRGSGIISSGSGVLKDVPYTYATRFGDTPGTNPEELIAAAHAACFSMAFASGLRRGGYQPHSIETRATCTISPQEQGGFRITRMRLETRGQVPGIDEATFLKIAREAKEGCPVSNALRGSVEIEMKAVLV
ncbi:MAG: OsmC family peroxiredoxin [Anaerolineae bacterium]|jgi:osmotically inducible protein OsmC|nr:OsmC family peroxiredoxin [Anaerolineae bacterium]